MSSDTVWPVVAKTLEWRLGNNVFEVFCAVDESEMSRPLNREYTRINAILVCRRCTLISPVRQCVLRDSSWFYINFRACMPAFSSYLTDEGNHKNSRFDTVQAKNVCTRLFYALGLLGNLQHQSLLPARGRPIHCNVRNFRVVYKVSAWVLTESCRSQASTFHRLLKPHNTRWHVVHFIEINK
jgi:hypothetical protein